MIGTASSGANTYRPSPVGMPLINSEEKILTHNDDMLKCFSSLFALILLYRSCSSPARPSTYHVLPRLLNACAAATNAEINSSIFKQCIIVTTENDIPCGISDFVATQPELFNVKFGSETQFRKAIFNQLINPWLLNAKVEPSILLNGCCIIFAHCLFIS